MATAATFNPEAALDGSQVRRCLAETCGHHPEPLELVAAGIGWGMFALGLALLIVATLRELRVYVGSHLTVSHGPRTITRTNQSGTTPATA